MPLKPMAGVVKRFGRHGVFGAGSRATARSTQNSALEAIGGGMRSGKPFAMPAVSTRGAVERFGRHGVSGAGSRATARSTQNDALEAIGGGMRSGKPFAMPAVRPKRIPVSGTSYQPVKMGPTRRGSVPTAPNPNKTSPGFFAQHGKKVAAGVAVGALGAGVMTSRTGKGVDAQTGLPRGMYNY